MSELSKPEEYRVIDSLDLRSFDNRLPDYGVKNYIDRLGFIPNIISLLECSIEQFHSNNGTIDNETIPYLWCSERAMPGGNVWSKRQLYGLIEAVHQYGSEFYFGCLSVPNKFAEYNTKSEWLYENSDVYDIFIMDNKGESLKDIQGGINVLRRLSDGRYYEDVMIKDLIKYLNDYNMDGFYAGDGWCGLWTPLWMGDYHPDMIDQFEKRTGTKVQGANTKEQSEFIWNIPQNRAKWIKFYSDRWTEFYQKFYSAMKKAGKGLLTIDPWAMGPADALYSYGIDYNRLAKIGIDALCLQAREENWGHRGAQWFYVWEPGEVANISTIRAQAPELHLYWAICTCNAPEHWIATKDVMNCLERQSLSLPSVTFIDDKGKYRRALEGLQFIFGTDVEKRDYNTLKKLWDMSFQMPINKTLGPVLVWSDMVHRNKIEKGERYDITAQALNFIMSGLPVHAAINTKNLKNATSNSYLLINPEGISDEEVQALIQQRSAGKNIIVAGDVSNELLLIELGIQKVKPTIPRTFKLTSFLPMNLLDRFENIWNTQKEYKSKQSDTHNWEDIKNTNTVFPNINIDRTSYICDEASPILSMETDDGDKVMVSVNKHKGHGNAIFIARAHHWPNETYAKGRYFTMQTLAKELPDDMDLFLASIISYLTEENISVDKGQIYAYETDEEKIHIGLGNCANLFYSEVTLNFMKDVTYIDDYPVKRYTPAGYIHFDTTARSAKVTVPPDGSVPMKIKFKK